MDIYENIFIGNFLYSLGICVGKRNNSEHLPISVNLLQQTPLDRSIGDVLLRGARTLRIIEFKRIENDDNKEFAKLEHLSRTLSVAEHQDLIPLSRQVHWFIGSLSKEKALNVRIVPYLDFRNTHQPEINIHSFINSMITEAHSESDYSTLYDRYLNVVALAQGSIKGSSGGIVVSVDSNGNISYVVVEDLRDLGLTLNKLHDVYLQRQIQLEHQLTAQSHDRSYDQGLSYDGP
ncbi:hypothetical protein GJ700_02985 [Duganella sp. FT92W]|uniref:Uncharacterized protein n=1 Tax=Pseudoduganella rivuli TaxID=2666085 RepID=A0A7X2LRC7_9BURK|nr:hypothetical protein [Pseudoduganella rivuli]MRV70683.1 hypothetical protein [Pseudoduganella rivuli]